MDITYRLFKVSDYHKGYLDEPLDGYACVNMQYYELSIIMFTF